MLAPIPTTNESSARALRVIDNLPMKPKFFRSPAAFYKWLEKNHDTATEVWVGFYKKATGKPSLTWSQSVDQALCFGWIDGIRKGIDEDSYKMRFTPRKPGSNWSAINVAKVAELKKQGLMRPAGLAAFERRRVDKTGVYSYEQRKDAAFDDAQLKAFKANRKAWTFFSAQAAGYRRTATYWVISAKREDTRTRRLQALIDDSENGRRLSHLTSYPKRT
jgi:uncharacterized protein YdeI (YjbR/CyaY-like superfamily)